MTVVVVVVGAGQAGVQVAASLREHGHAGRVVLVDTEEPLPYQRPPLSKTYLTDREPAEPTLRSAAFYAEHGIELRTGTRVRAVDVAAGVVTFGDGADLRWTDLVLATGSRPVPLAVPGTDLGGVLPLRTLADARRLRALLPSVRRVVVIGGGFIGLEVAGAALTSGAAVTVLEAAPRLLGRSVTATTAEVLLAHHRRWGIDVRVAAKATEIVGEHGKVRAVRTSDGDLLPAELVVVGIGITARDELAREAGLAVDDGIVVDAGLRTAHPHVYAIGDCARFPGPGVSTVRLESVQNATDQAEHVAQAIATGATAPYGAVPWFWSHQHGARLQMAGLTTGTDDTVVTGDPGKPAFSVYCFRGGALVGVESVNRPADHLKARKLLAEGRPVRRTEFGAGPGVTAGRLSREERS
ncbi:FAD-dependent oxidoreductase [Amycolatopsis rhabdoformis]|uniref:FAD-dependent oxidoreductase n=1 Tax=Amycolatopsis rhabdoformis TaxID=1448059 RepID=A0ABZ1IDE9_9PSEU|nr:FAD-dependent oxidoreductase [Amycolatopsis rhabdoformis]WSE32491.1 FAD-dependent oxidoreductase [Amycolatopsis rhabdoformis]